MANQNDFIVKYGLVVESTTTISSANNLVTTNIVRPPAKPSLDFNFTRSSSLDPRISFTRASGATYVGKDGLIKYAGANQPRFDYDPITGQNKGLLIEEQITNLLTYSTLIGSGSWNTRVGTTSVISSGIAPDGSNNATLVTYASGDGYVWESFTFSTSTSYIFSIYAKTASGTPTIRFNAYTGVSGQAYTSGATTLTSNYTRYSFSFTSTATTSAGDVGFYIINGAATVWGAQLETSNLGISLTSPTSIIPTQASQVTRSVDIVSLLPNYNLFNPRLGTFLLDFDATNTNYSFVIYGSTTLGEIATVRGLTDVGTWNGTGQVDAINSTANNTSRAKYAISYNATQVNNVLSGGTVSSSNSYPIIFNATGGPITLYIGSGGTNSRVIDGHIRRITYWPTMLPNAQLQQLTRQD